MQSGSILSTTRQTLEKNTTESYNATLSRFRDYIGNDRQLDGITSEDILSFLSKITQGDKQQTKHGRYSQLKAFFNFIKSNFNPNLLNPCDTPMLRKLYRPGKPNHWSIVEKEIIDEIIFRTVKPRNRLSWSSWPEEG
jgi:integrase/recombinase XerD